MGSLKETADNVRRGMRAMGFAIPDGELVPPEIEKLFADFDPEKSKGEASRLIESVQIILEDEGLEDFEKEFVVGYLTSEFLARYPALGLLAEAMAKRANKEGWFEPGKEA